MLRGTMTAVSRRVLAFVLAVCSGAALANPLGDAKAAWLRDLTNAAPLANWAKRVGAASTQQFFANGPYWIDGEGAVRRFDFAAANVFPLGAFASVRVDGLTPTIDGANVVAAPAIQVTCAPQPNRPTLASAFVQLTQLRGPSGASQEVPVAGSPMPGRGSKRAAAAASLPLARSGAYLLRSILVASCADARGRDELVVVPVLTGFERP